MKHRITWLFFLIAAVLCFIWGNSALSGEESAAISGGVLKWLIDHFPILKGMPEVVLRKIGHFSEFALLGFLLTWFFLWRGQKGVHRVTMPLLIAMLAANADETIQTVTPHRGPSVIDVWIDVAGAAVGITVLLLAYALLKYRKRKGKP